MERLTKTYQLSNATEVVVEELNGREQLVADGLVGQAAMTIASVRSLVAVRSVKRNGETRPYSMPADRRAIDALAQSFTGRELTKLTNKFMEDFMDDEVASGNE